MQDYKGLEAIDTLWRVREAIGNIKANFFFNELHKISLNFRVVLFFAVFGKIYFYPAIHVISNVCLHKITVQNKNNDSVCNCTFWSKSSPVLLPRYSFIHHHTYGVYLNKSNVRLSSLPLLCATCMHTRRARQASLKNWDLKIDEFWGTLTLCHFLYGKILPPLQKLSHNYNRDVPTTLQK